MIIVSFFISVVPQHISSFTLEKTEDGGVKMESGKGKCPFEPSQRYTAVMAGKWKSLNSCLLAYLLIPKPVLL